MEYTKCSNYPRCTFIECECYQKKLFEDMHKGMKKVDPIVTNKKIIRFEIINGELRPIYET